MHFPPAPERPRSIAQEIHEVEKRIQRDIWGVLIGGGLMFTSGSFSVLGAVIQQYEAATTLAGSCVMSMAAMRQFLMSIDAGEGLKKEIIESYFRR